MLDTNIASELIRNPAGAAAQRAKAEGEAVCVSVIVAAELRYGCAKKASPRLTQRVEDFLSEVLVLPFAAPADREYGEIRARLERVGKLVGPNDLFVASHALSIGATLVTANESEFCRVRGLRIENWLTEPR